MSVRTMALNFATVARHIEGGIPEELPSRSGPLEYLSASRFKSYLTCPLRFYFEKVAGISKPVSIKAHLGRAVHEALQTYNRSRWLGEALSREEVEEVFSKAFRLKESVAEVKTEEEEVWNKLETIGRNLVSAYLLSGIHPVDQTPRGVEVRLSERIEGLPIKLLGILDLVLPGNHIVDYKTTACRPDKFNEPWLHEIQLMTYVHLVEAATGEPVKGLQLVFLVKTKAPQVIAVDLDPPTEVQRQRFRQLVDVYVSGVTKGRYHPCPGNHCSWCPFTKECRQWTGNKELHMHGGTAQ